MTPVPDPNRHCPAVAVAVDAGVTSKGGNRSHIEQIAKRRASSLIMEWRLIIYHKDEEEEEQISFRIKVSTSDICNWETMDKSFRIINNSYKIIKEEKYYKGCIELILKKIFLYDFGSMDLTQL